MSNNNVKQGMAGNGLLLLSLVVFLVSLIYAFMQIGSNGHASFNTSSALPWGQPIATYLYFALASSGLGLLASLPLVFGFKQYYPVAKRCIFLAFIVLISGMAVLAMELGNVFRMLWAIPLNFQTQSAMFWMGIFYALDLLFLLWKFRKMESGEWDSKTSKQVGIASFLLVLLASGNLALIFGMMSMRPFWFDALLPIYFYFTAVTSGMAALVFFVYLSHGFRRDTMSPALQKLMTGAVPKLFAALVGGTLLFIAARAITGMYSNNPEINLVWTDYLFSSTTYHLSLWVGLLLPFIILLNSNLRNQVNMQLLASILVFLGLFSERFFFVVGGQVVPLFKGTWIPNLIQYSPSATEWSLTIMGWSLIFVLYVLGEKFFNLSAMPDNLDQDA
ncbi:NrfD/PsrC family molybdoenzyme membrane anchor subunit [Marinospirillum alkaliphilum]|uniref:Prokaryotic molybdopterin-containing oxidoreductase family, membrane subunit n=1 Tax=Marinospirillum alkaliphilum DSM 21637 TaxID=1122209 RepID=A0A1K1ZKQ8_9GAMM|nr:NrfD/PsrC family molybdoenzyme membrane anchor subunit [Marinospirillum alkaliphilum]SFX74729.1 prokaryotic molybdopterin-containing oxidoreductase family, membrane subunit [Marinospirillum alkaliphilum DSM 21637]